jgi:hypothetical protein
MDQEDDDEAGDYASISIFRMTRVLRERAALLDTLKHILATAEILVSPRPGSDLERRFAAAHDLIAQAEAE